jgi:hypothetical protein
MTIGFGPEKLPDRAGRNPPAKRIAECERDYGTGRCAGTGLRIDQGNRACLTPVRADYAIDDEGEDSLIVRGGFERMDDFGEVAEALLGDRVHGIILRLWVRIPTLP